MFLEVCVGVSGVQEKGEQSRANKERNGLNQTQSESKRKKERESASRLLPLFFVAPQL